MVPVNRQELTEKNQALNTLTPDERSALLGPLGLKETAYTGEAE